MKNCPNCGAPIADNASFCGNCGTKVEASETVTFEDPIRGFNPDKVQEQPPVMQAQQMQYQQPQMQSQDMGQMQGQAMQYQDPAQMQGQMMQPAQPQQMPQAFQPGQMQYQQPYMAPNPQAGLITAIKVFLVLACIFSIGALCIPLAWRLPMTIVAFRKMDNRQPLGLAFKICSLLFVGFIPGILMLALNDDMYPTNGYQQY